MMKRAMITAMMVMVMATTAHAEIDITGLYPNVGIVTSVYDESKYLTVTEILDEAGDVWTVYDDGYDVGEIVAMIMYDGGTAEDPKDDEVLRLRSCGVPCSSYIG